MKSILKFTKKMFTKEKIKEFAKDTAETGIEIGTTAVHSTINGVLVKAGLFILFIVILITGGCVGGSVAIDALTN